MADLTFLNTTDCSAVTVETPESLFIDYITRNQVKDFSDIKKYVLTYSKNDCDFEEEPTIVNIPPNYQLAISIQSCIECQGLDLQPASCYNIRLTGVNSSLITQVSYCSGLFCFSQGYTVIDDYTIEFQALPMQLGGATREHRITTSEGFQYYFQFDLTGQTTAISCDATIANFAVQIADYPAIVDNPSSSLSLNTLFDLPILTPGLYTITICEENINPELDECITNTEFIDCDGIFDCEIPEICDSTDNVCNLTKEVMQKHQSIIYGLSCCKEINQRIMKHWIKLYCPDALEPEC